MNQYPSASNIFCTQCGAKIESTQKFCEQCGNNLQASSALEPMDNPTPVNPSTPSYASNSQSDKPSEVTTLDSTASTKPVPLYPVPGPLANSASKISTIPQTTTAAIEHNNGKFDFKNASRQALNQKYKEIMQENGDYNFFVYKEINYLQSLVIGDEQILSFCSGNIGLGTWLIVLTDRRIILLNKGLIWGLKQQTISLGSISDVISTTSIMWGKIDITPLSGQGITIDQINKSAVVKFTNKVQSALHEYRNPVSVEYEDAPVPTMNQPDPIQQLEKLAELKERGVITEEEFNAKKSQLLGL